VIVPAAGPEPDPWSVAETGASPAATTR
jgi:hypothetical protein